MAIPSLLPEALQVFALPIAIGFGAVAIISLGAAVVSIIRQRQTPQSHSDQVTVGNDSVSMGAGSGSVGDRSVRIGPTDSRGNTVLNQPMAVGRGAKAGPGSIAIGANAGAGAIRDVEVDRNGDDKKKGSAS